MKNKKKKNEQLRGTTERELSSEIVSLVDPIPGDSKRKGCKNTNTNGM